MGLRISIVIPSYNQDHYLDDAIRSLLDQEYPDLELIVMDGGSTDRSRDIIRSYEDRIAYWRSQPDGGQSAALADGFKRATGDILGWLNSDDLLLPEALGTVASYFTKHPECAWLYGNSHVVDESGHVIARRTVPRISAWELAHLTLFLPQESTFFRKELYEKTTGVDPSLHFAMDYDLWLKFMQVASPDRLPQFLGCFRLVAGQKSSDVERYHEEELQVKARLGYRPAPTGHVVAAKVRTRSRSLVARVSAEGPKAPLVLVTNQIRVLRGAPGTRGASKPLALASVAAVALGAAAVGRLFSRRRRLSR